MSSDLWEKEMNLYHLVMWPYNLIVERKEDYTKEKYPKDDLMWFKKSKRMPKKEDCKREPTFTIIKIVIGNFFLSHVDFILTNKK